MVPEWKMEAYERLRREIVRHAVDDLKRAMKKSDRLGYVCVEQENLEEWFLSPWGQTLCFNNGEYIIEKCLETYKQLESRKNGRKPIPESKQKEVYDAYIDGVSALKIMKKYKLTEYQFKRIVREWR